MGGSERWPNGGQGMPIWADYHDYPPYALPSFHSSSDITRNERNWHHFLYNRDSNSLVLNYMGSALVDGLLQNQVTAHRPIGTGRLWSFVTKDFVFYDNAEPIAMVPTETGNGKSAQMRHAAVFMIDKLAVTMSIDNIQSLAPALPKHSKLSMIKMHCYAGLRKFGVLHKFLTLLS
jgi:hypothetical protein